MADARKSGRVWPVVVFLALTLVCLFWGYLMVKIVLLPPGSLDGKDIVVLVVMGIVAVRLAFAWRALLKRVIRHQPSDGS